MADEIDTRVSLDLDPEAVFATIEDYDDDTDSYLSPAKAAFTEAFSPDYSSDGLFQVGERSLTY